MENKSFPGDDFEATWIHISARACSGESMLISKASSRWLYCDSYEWHSQCCGKVLWVTRLRSYQCHPTPASMLVSLYTFRSSYVHNVLLSTAFPSSELLGQDSCVWLLQWLADYECELPKGKAEGCTILTLLRSFLTRVPQELLQSISLHHGAMAASQDLQMAW